MDERDWKDRYGLDPAKQHARLTPLETWDEIPSPNAIEWGVSDGDTTATMVLRDLGRLVVHWRGHLLTGISLKGL